MSECETATDVILHAFFVFLYENRQRKLQKELDLRMTKMIMSNNQFQNEEEQWISKSA